MSKQYIYITKDDVKLYGDEYEPQGEAKAVLLIVHGMAEHRKRYADFGCNIFVSTLYCVIPAACIDDKSTDANISPLESVIYASEPEISNDVSFSSTAV